MVPGLEHKRLTSFDGTEIAYQVRGSGPAIVLANGLGGFYEYYRHIYAALGDRYRIICWDYRGIYRSAAPRRHEALAVPYHCGDLECILDAERIDRAVFVGWSMGVQVNFEFFRQRRNRIAGLVALNGTSGRLFHSVASSRALRYVVPMTLRLLRAEAELVRKVSRRATAWEGMIPLLQRVGFVSRRVDRDAFSEILTGFGGVDWRLYGRTLAELGDHDASDLLPEIDVPTLIISGDRDLQISPVVAERMHRAIPGSRLVIVRDATHYLAIEHPDIVTEELCALLAEVEGYAPRAEPAPEDGRAEIDARAVAGAPFPPAGQTGRDDRAGADAGRRMTRAQG